MRQTNARLPELPPLRPKMGRGIAQSPVGPKLIKTEGIVPALNGWGGVDVGRWCEARDTFNGQATVAGVCARCTTMVRAIDLKPTQLRDGSSAWVCDECRSGN